MSNSLADDESMMEEMFLAAVEEQCDSLRAIGFCDVDCFWKYSESATFGGFKSRWGTLSTGEFRVGVGRMMAWC